jgi:hypothetical protein
MLTALKKNKDSRNKEKTEKKYFVRVVFSKKSHKMLKVCDTVLTARLEQICEKAHIYREVGIF